MMTDPEKRIASSLAFYSTLLDDIKERICQGRLRATLAVNAEMLRLYWDIGSLIAQRQQMEGWGAGVIPRLARDLHNELPEEKGFSETNLKRMVQFSREYPALFPIGAQPVPQLTTDIDADEKGARPVPQLENNHATIDVQQTIVHLPWSHNIILMQKVKDISMRLWYAQQVRIQGWSRDTLVAMIKSRAHERRGAAVTIFAARLPDRQSDLAVQILKDPYIFDFLTLEEPFRERELETGLVRQIEKFLLELGRGFAFVGRQYRIEVSDREYYLDLLFYHLHLRCFVVVDLKKGDFKPEYAGKMNFYCSVVDDILRHETDQPTIGLILCQTKDRILAEYSLRDIHKPIGVSDYELTRVLPPTLKSSLPSIEQIETELSGDLRNMESEERPT